MKYRAEIDGLRAIAVLPVIFFHAGFSLFSGGFVGVDVFFVISGYLITHIILSELAQNSFSLINFYERRARRILPALFAVMLVSIPLSLIWLAPSDLESYFNSLTAVSLFSSNILFWLESSYWGVASELKPLIHTWSLAVEEQYYVIFPLLMMVLWRFNKRIILGCLLLITVLSLALAQWSFAASPEANFFLLPTRMWELAIGAMAAKLLIDQNRAGLNINSNKPLNGFLTLVGFIMIVLAVILFDEDTAHPSVYTLLPTVGTCLVILFASSDDFIGRLLGTKLLTQIGLISYSVYLWHQLFFAIARHQSSSEPNSMYFSVLIILTLIAAYLTYRYIETPFRNRNLFSRKKIFIFTFFGTAFFITIGLFGKVNDAEIIEKINPEYKERRVFLNSLSRGRKSAVRSSNCHHVNSSKFKRVDEFIEDWSCTGAVEKTLSNSRIGLFGDSHGADKAHMLTLAGVKFLHVGGTACSLLPTRGRCKSLLTFFHEKAAENGVNVALISNQFNEKELKQENLIKLVDYWSSRYEQVYLFSPMVEFPYWRKQYQKTGKLEFIIDTSSHDQFFQAFETISLPDNVRLINTGHLLCNDLSNCSIQDKSGNILLSDSNHLSKFGAKHLGEKLMPILSEWISQFNKNTES